MSNRLWDVRNSVLQETLKKSRENAGLTQAELGDRLSKPQSYVSKYENGERKLDYLELCDVCDALEITISSFNKSFITQLNRK